MKSSVPSRATAKPVEGSTGKVGDGIFAGLFGALLGLALLKFGSTPVVMERMVVQPTNIFEWALTPWPAAIGYWLLAVIVVAGLFIARWRTNAPVFLVALPLLWLVWEVIAGTQSESTRISSPTVIHFASCVVCFYLGLFSLSRVERLNLFWVGLIAGFGLVLVSGLHQHFGGLEETRRFMLYMYASKGETFPEAMLKKMESKRIFGTLFYANTLAQVILMVLPVALAAMWSWRKQLTQGARIFLMCVMGVAALGCLYWSGSKGGWLIMLVTGLTGAMFFPFKRQTKLLLVGAVLVLGLTGFGLKYAGFFKRGATSVVERFHYWQAAVVTVKDKPVFGTGPGTFGKVYETRKRPEWEMAQLAHNDYLQQASDSGVPGFLLYGAMVIGTLVYGWRRGRLGSDWVKLAVWLGVLGWALQSLMEFGLYIPAVGWLAFAFMGWLLGQGGNQFDSRPADG